MTAKLIVCVDQVAFLRASRKAKEPDPVHFALQAELAGAMGIRAHLRIDRRDLGEQDMELFNRMVKTQFYLQVSPHQDIVHLVNGLRPHNLVLSGERREGALENGLDVTLLAKELLGIIKNIDNNQTRVFMFVEPQLDQVKAAAKLGVHGLLINVRDVVGEARSLASRKSYSQLADVVRLSAKYGLETHIGGGIQAEHLPFLMKVPGIMAVHLGHQLVARSLQMGVVQAVKSYLNLLS